jgi:three-Cys-motif partner protein
MKKFGGDWTAKKLGALEKYFKAYRVVFTRNEAALYFKTMYIDGFAGSGLWKPSDEPECERLALFEEEESAEAVEYARGSARIALDLVEPFDQYEFIDLDPSNCEALQDLVSCKHPDLSHRVSVRCGDCNEKVLEICGSYDWKRWRGVCFLDPYGMQIDWKTLVALAGTKALDVWFLFPLGIGVMRLLMKDRMPEGPSANRLSRMLGSDEWKERFYEPTGQSSLFDNESDVRRKATIDHVGQYFIQRLRSIFSGVLPQPLVLMNSKGNPLFLMCFAVGNPKGIVGLRIAWDIVGKG